MNIIDSMDLMLGDIIAIIFEAKEEVVPGLVGKDYGIEGGMYVRYPRRGGGRLFDNFETDLVTSFWDPVLHELAVSASGNVAFEELSRHGLLRCLIPSI